MLAQQLWVQSSGGQNVDEAMDVCVNSSGESYVTGYFTNTASFHPFNLSSSSQGIPDGFIYKTNSSGNIVWAKKFGGMGSDRGINCKLDGNGDLIICGYYFGSASFGTLTLNSTAGSQDVFVAKVDANGNFIWAVSMGGNMIDIPNALAIDKNDNILITGSFQGVATFGSSTFTSITNPQNNIASYDVFTSKISPAGSFIWTRTGQAKYEDRGLNIACDTLNNVYVCGQFSDTIKFNNTHNNQIMNAVFLIKYSANGNELWFKKASATSAIAYGLEIDKNNNHVIMAGDFTGTMVFYGSPNASLSGNFQNKIFVAKFNESGGYIWGKSDASINYISARDITIDNTGDIYLFGEFTCGLTDYQNAIAQGVFNSVGFRDLFVSKYSGTNGNRLWEKQAGGTGDDKAHGIVLTGNNRPILAASYMGRFSFPYSTPMLVNPNTQVFYTSGPQPPLYCSDNNYNGYITSYGLGFSDAIAGTFIEPNRQTLDFFHRSGNTCSRPILGSCINYLSLLCPDTVKLCDPDYIQAYTFTGVQGPNYKYKWNTGDTASTILVGTTGVYHVTVTTRDNCLTSSDTVYVKMNPKPPVPKITDSKGFNFQQLPVTNKIRFCSLDSVKITGSNIFNNAFSWSGFPIMSAPDSSIWVNQKVGKNIYAITVTNSYSCTSVNSVTVEIDTIYPIIPKIKLNDTVTFCCGQKALLYIYDSITNPNANPLCLNLLDTIIWSVQPNTASVYNSIPYNNCNKPTFGGFQTCTSGDYTITAVIKINNTCGINTYTTSKVVHAIANPNPTILLTYTGSPQLCPGDSNQFIVQHSHPINWTGPGINASNQSNDTLWIKHPGYYTIFSVAVNSLTGCSTHTTKVFTVNNKPNPVLTKFPAIICPNDSVKLTVNITNGLNYAWVGPFGPIAINAHTIWVKIPGFYHVVVTDASGCVLTSNTIEVKQYNTPFIVPIPSNYLCPGGTVTLKVVTNDSTLIQWFAPLSGGGTVKTVTATGIYSCQITMCGITTICTVQIHAANPTASITASQFTFCPGDSTILTANSNMAGYQWLPGNLTSSVISIFETGNYTLVTTDVHGCQATSTISVFMNNNTPPPIPASNSVAICYGTSTVVNAVASGSVSWYTSATGGSSFHVGNQYTTPNLTAPVVYYVANIDTSYLCPSQRVPITVDIVPASYPITASVNAISICAGDSIKFFTPFVQNATYHWSGPNSFTSNLQNPIIAPANSTHSGTYTLWVSGQSCSSNTVQLSVQIVQLTMPTIVATASVCEGDTIFVSTSSNSAAVNYTWTGPNNFTSTATQFSIAPAQAIHSGPYQLINELNGCFGESNSVMIQVNSVPQVTPMAYSSGCVGDSAIFWTNSLTSNITYYWSGPNNFSTGQPSFVINPINQNNSGTYTFFASNNGCPSPVFTLNINSYPIPPLWLGPDTTLCFPNTILTLTVPNYPYITWQDNSSAPSYTIVNTPGTYWVHVTDSNGCSNADTIQVQIMECDEFFVSEVFTPNGDGKNDFFVIKGMYGKRLKLTVFNRWGNAVYKNENYDNSWNGNSNVKNVFGSNEKLPPGTYYYLLEFPDKERENRKGYVVIQY